MRWRDEGFVLSARRHGETSVIVSLLTRDHGRHSGLVRGGAGRRMRGIHQTGNLVAARWRARLDEHLGTYRCELVRPHAAAFLPDRTALAALAAAAATLERLMPEREPQPEVFERFGALVEGLSRDADWRREFVRWELGLLRHLGYGLDLDRCAATGAVGDLVYVSPRSGCAVSAGAGRPWHDRLLPLPAFLRADLPARLPEILDGLALTGHFLERCARETAGRGLPRARARLVDLLRGGAPVRAAPPASR